MIANDVLSNVRVDSRNASVQEGRVLRDLQCANPPE